MSFTENTNKAKYTNYNRGDTVSAASLIYTSTVKFYFSRSFNSSDKQPHLTIAEIATHYSISK